MSAKVITLVKCLNQSNQFWRNDKTNNRLFVELKLKYCYEKFKAQGHLFLNEVYDQLGMPRTTSGQVAGWVFDVKYEKEVMWSIQTNHDDCDVYITFKPWDNIFDILTD